MSNFCGKCGNKIENNGSYCINCGNQVNLNNLNTETNKKKNGYGKCILFTILGSLGIFLLSSTISFIFGIAGIKLNITFIKFGLPILGIVFSPIIALIIYSIKNK